jgi:DNA-binding NarL/FixJ family response regulator
MGRTGRARDDAAGVATTVLIVDDHDGFRARARRLLDAEGYSVVGEAADGAGALAEVARLAPDVVLLDLHLPDQTGWDVACTITSRPQAPAVVMTSTRDAEDVVARARECGARGFIAKSELSGAAIGALLDQR